MKKITARSLHRDLGYFFAGLIITFSISGLFLNHREKWHPLRYEYNSMPVEIASKMDTSAISETNVVSIANELKIKDKLRRFGTEGDMIWISFENTDVEFNKSTKKGILKQSIITPILGQMTKLHIDTNKFWIIYSDIFAIALLVIAITAMLFPNGKYSFKRYGWKLALAGIVLPLVFLLVF